MELLNRNWESKSKKKLSFYHDEKIVRNVVYEFKKFAREQNFWEDYKRFSTQLQKGFAFYDVVDKYEPVKLIQNVEAFCRWCDCPTIHPWDTLTKMWVDTCLKNDLYYCRSVALEYVNNYISHKIYNKYKER